MIISKPTRIGIAPALIAAGLLAACAPRLLKQPEKEIVLPPAFSSTPIRMGMPLWEAQAAYPQQKPEWVQPHLITFQFTTASKVLAKQPGIFALPVGTFYDEKLDALVSVVSFNGKSLKPDETDLIHAELLKECEALYGTEHDQAVIHKSSTTGNDYSQISWNKPAYKAALSLAHIHDQPQPQKIAALEVLAVKQRRILKLRANDILRALLGVNVF